MSLFARSEMSARVRRVAIALPVSLALMATACSAVAEIPGVGGEVAADAPAVVAVDAQTTAAQGGDTTTAGAAITGLPSTSNPAALPTGPISAADIQVFRPNESVVRLLPITPVVNSCDVLSGAEFSAIVDDFRNEVQFGSADPLVFPDGELLGAECIFRADTHVISIIVGSAAQASADAGSLVLPIFAEAEDFMTIPWDTNPAISVLSEDSFGFPSTFGAHATADGYGIIVNNRGGTGIDLGSGGEIWARIAQAAAGAVGSAGPAVSGDPNANVQTARPCDLFEPADIAAFVGATVTEERLSGGGDSCTWEALNQFPSGAVVVRIRHRNDQASALQNLSPSPDFPGLWVSNSNTFYVVTDEAIISVQVAKSNGSGGFDESFNIAAAERELLLNIAARIAG